MFSANEALLSALQASRNEIYVFEADSLRFRHVNHGALRNLGFSLEELLKLTPLDLKPEFTEARFRAILAPLIDGDRDQLLFETLHRRADGSHYPAEVHLQLVEQAGERLLVAVVLDITDRRNKETQLQVLEQAVAASLTGFALANLQGQLTYVNDTFVRMWACSDAAQCVGRPVVEFWRSPGAAQDVVNALQQHGVWHGELEGRRGDGSHMFVQVSAHLLRDVRGAPVCMLASFADLTERLRAEERLRTLNEELEQRVEARTRELLAERNFIDRVLETAGALVTVIDSTGRIVRFNRACERATGFAFAELRNQPIWDCLIPPEQMAGVKQVFAQLKANAVPSQYENEWLTRSGSRRLIAWANTVMTDSTGNVEYVIATGLDITEQRAAELALRLAKEEAERASRAKSEFLSRVSHELRTPLNAILGFTQLLAMTNPTAAQQAKVDEISTAGRHLLDLINELLDLGRIESGALALSREVVDLSRALEECIAMVAQEAASRGIEITQDLPTAARLVEGDEKRTRQILLNLLSNAIKYNRPQGTARVRCEERDNGRVRVSVTDTGYGIEPELLGRVFQPFDRLGAESGDVEGSGIGLAISKRLVEMMGGSIGLESAPGAGSCFWFELPRSQHNTLPSPAHPAATHPTAARRDGRVVLYIEDNAANRRLISEFIRQWGRAELVLASDGQSGLTVAAARQPDVILLDLHLPDMDGFTVLTELRSDRRTASIPVVALTADAMPEDIQRGLDAGFYRYLTKPVNIAELSGVLAAAVTA